MTKNTCIVLMLILLSLALSGCAGKANDADAGLTIDAASLTAEPSFIDWTQDGTPMQLIALRDDGGAVRLAYNTCQSCNGSPYAWFEYLGGGILQCQNCGQLFETSVVGTAKAAGCNPITLTDFSVDGGTVRVSESALKEAKSLFKNWKAVDG